MSSGIEVFRGDNGETVVNASGFADLGDVAQVLNGAESDPFARQAFSAMASWINDRRPPPSRRYVGGLFDRDRFVDPGSPFGRMATARRAMSDDIVGGAADVTESLALAAIGVNTDNLDERSVWKQILADLDFDSRLREIWRVLFTDSQVVVATWWGRKTYKSTILTPQGQQPRATYDLVVPQALSILDTTRVTPIGTLMFNQERLAFVATAVEASYLDGVLARRDGLTTSVPDQSMQGQTIYDNSGHPLMSATVPDSGFQLSDPIVERLITSRYVPDRIEAQQLIADGVNPMNLFAFDPRFVFRHTLTRPQFQRFSDIRLQRTFEHLDLKTQLHQVDRAFLVGGANYIVLITKGSDAIPARQAEIDNLRAHVQTVGQVPVLVGDHRLNIEIVTPKVDITLNRARYDTIDSRLMATTYGMFSLAENDMRDPLKTGRVIASGLENRRRMVKRTVEAGIFDPIRLSNPKLTGKAKLVFLPSTISLAFDDARAAFLLDMREGREISRETFLTEFGLDQDEEAIQLEREAIEYDPIFKSFSPHGANPAPPTMPPDQVGPAELMSVRRLQRHQGRRLGGNRNGGGRAPGTRQGKTSVNPRHSDTGPTKIKRPSAALATFQDALYEDDLPDDTTVDDLHELVDDHLLRPDLVAVARLFHVKQCHRLKAEDLRAALHDQIDSQEEAEPDA